MAFNLRLVLTYLHIHSELLTDTSTYTEALTKSLTCALPCFCFSLFSPSSFKLGARATNIVLRRISKHTTSRCRPKVFKAVKGIGLTSPVDLGMDIKFLAPQKIIWRILIYWNGEPRHPKTPRPNKRVRNWLWFGIVTLTHLNPKANNNIPLWISMQRHKHIS